MNPLPKTTEAIDSAAPELINWLREAAPKGADLIQTQAPLFAEELIRYAVWSGVLMTVLGFLLLIVGAVLVFCDWKRWNVGVGVVFGTLGCIAGLILIPAGIAASLKPLVAPRVFLVEETARLVYGERR